MNKREISWKSFITRLLLSSPSKSGALFSSIGHHDLTHIVIPRGLQYISLSFVLHPGPLIVYSTSFLDFFLTSVFSLDKSFVVHTVYFLLSLIRNRLSGDYLFYWLSEMVLCLPLTTVVRLISLPSLRFAALT